VHHECIFEYSQQDNQELNLYIQHRVFLLLPFANVEELFQLYIQVELLIILLAILENTFVMRRPLKVKERKKTIISENLRTFAQTWRFITDSQQ
jgi:hypothetical protein